MDLIHEVDHNTIVSMFSIMHTGTRDKRTIKDKVIRLKELDETYNNLINGSLHIKYPSWINPTKYIEIMCFILDEKFIMKSSSLIKKIASSTLSMSMNQLLSTKKKIYEDSFQKDCDTCFDNANIIYQCIRCKNNICYTCIIQSNKYTCWKCDENISIWALKEIYNKSDLYKRYYVETVIKGYTNINFIIFRYETLINLDKDIYSIDIQSTKFIIPCNKLNCMGNVYDTKCIKCFSVHCMKCNEITEDIETHICNQDIINNLEFIKQNTKKCPKCLISIEKIIETCNDMVCVQCGTYFNWRTLKIDTKPNSNRHYNLLINSRDMDIISEFNKFYSTFVYYYNYRDYNTNFRGKHNNFFLYINASNVFSRYAKKKIIWEYKYISELNKDKKMKCLYKLFDIYQVLEFCNIIYAMNFQDLKNIILLHKYNIFYPKINIFKNCINLYKINNPLKNTDIFQNTELSKKKILRYYYKKNTNNISEELKLPIDNNIYNYLKEHNMYISKHIDKDLVLGTLSTQMEQIIIVSTKLSLKQWQNYSNKHTMQEIHVPVHNLLLDNKKNIFYLFKSSKCIFNCNFLHIISMNNTCIIIDIKNETITYREELFYSLLITHCLNHRIPLIIIYNIFNFEIYFTTHSMFLDFSINKSFNRCKKHDIVEFYQSTLITQDYRINEQQYYKEYFINTTNTDILSCKSYNPNKLNIDYKTIYLIYQQNNISIYRYSDKFAIYKKKDSKVEKIKHDHQICSRYKKCLFCITCCESIGSNYKIYNNTDISMCCYIHGLNYINIKSYSDKCINLHNAIEYFNLSAYEINLLTILYNNLNIILLRYIYNKSHDEKKIIIPRNIIYKYINAYIEKEKDKTTDVFDIFYIQYHVLPIHIHIMDDFQRELTFAQHMVNKIYNELLVNPLYEYKKYILILYFKKSIKWIKRYFKDKKISFLDTKTSNNNKIDILNKFGTTNRLLVISATIELPEHNMNDKDLIEIMYLSKNNINIKNADHVHINKIINLFNINKTYNVTYTEYNTCYTYPNNKNN